MSGLNGTENSQVFQHKVGHVFQADSVNVTLNRDNERTLTPAERAELNSKVKQLAEFGKSGRDIWLFIHRAIGVSGVAEMRIGQRDSALAILDLMLEKAEIEKKLAEADRRKTQPSESMAAQHEWLSHQKNHLEIELQRIRPLAELSQKNKTLFDGVLIKNTELTEALTREQARSKLLRLVAIVASCVAVISVVVSVFQFRQVGLERNKLKMCVFDGRFYGLGTLLNNTRECVLDQSGIAEWRIGKEGRRGK